MGVCLATINGSTSAIEPFYSRGSLAGPLEWTV